MRFIPLVLTSVTLMGCLMAAEKDELARFVGTWKGTGSSEDTPYSRKSAQDGTTVCQWSSMRAFLVCDQEHSAPGGRARDLSVYTYDESSHKYRFFNLGQDGHHTAIGIELRKDEVIYQSDPGEDDPKTVFRTVNKWESPDRYTYRAEFSTDNGKHWTTMASGVSVRVK